VSAAAEGRRPVPMGDERRFGSVGNIQAP
jgi:hypothetical protein